MGSPWALTIAPDDIEWLQNDQNIEHMRLDSDGLEDLFPEHLEGLFASVRTLDNRAEEPLLNGDVTERLSLELLGARNSEGDDDYGQALQTSSPFDLSSPERVYGDVQEIEPTNGTVVENCETMAKGWQRVPQDLEPEDVSQLSQSLDDMFDMETRGRPRRASVRMVCRAGQVSSMRRFQRSVQKSDSSWDEQDNLENFCDSLKTRLDEIGDPSSNVEKYFITDYLSRKKRRLVHALAHLGRFNHMTLDETKERRILVTTATIGCKGNHALNKCWNERKSQWKLDPRTLIIMFPHNIERDQLCGTLTDMNLPLPHSFCQIAYSQHRRLFLAEFNTAGAAARVIDRLQDQYSEGRSGPGADICIDVSYRYWSQNTPADATFKVFGDVSEQQSWSDKILFLPHRHYHHAKSSKYPPLVYRYDWSRSFNRRRMSRGTSTRETDSSDGSHSSSKRPYKELDVDAPKRTHLSDLSNDELKILVGGPSRDASSDSTAKRRRRHPKQAGGYPCSECGKVFNYNGERTKHELIHKPKEEHPHACSYCEMRFINRKDLQRHEKVHLAKRFCGIRGDNGCQTD
jgi:hypothetical protein